jgi:hypothetical protein
VSRNSNFATILILVFGLYVYLYFSRTKPLYYAAGHLGTRPWPNRLVTISTRSQFEGIAFRPLLRTEAWLSRHLHFHRKGGIAVAGMTGTPRGTPRPTPLP